MTARRAGGTRDFFESVDGGDSRMAQARQRARLPLEARFPFLVFQEIPGQDLDGDVSSRSRVAGFPDLAHPSVPKSGFSGSRHRERVSSSDIGASLSGHVTFVQNPPQLLLRNETRSLPEDGAKSSDIKLVVSRDRQSLIRTAGGPPKLDVASSLRDRHESELPEDSYELATGEPTKLRHTPARSPA